MEGVYEGRFGGIGCCVDSEGCGDGLVPSGVSSPLQSCPLVFCPVGKWENFKRVFLHNCEQIKNYNYFCLLNAQNNLQCNYNGATACIRVALIFLLDGINIQQ